MSIPCDVAVFDAYGTLLDVHSAMQRHAARLGDGWPALSAEWRQKQVEYTWVRSLAPGHPHRDFARVTQDALHAVAARHGIADQALLDDLMEAYSALQAFPEVPAMLAAVRAAGLRCAILSNGSPAMLERGVRAAGLDGLLDAVLSIEQAGVYKPDARVYALVGERFGVAPERVAFMSGNPWDAFGALCAGFRVVWVNRAGLPDEYDLRAGIAAEVADLSPLPRLLARSPA